MIPPLNYLLLLKPISPFIAYEATILAHILAFQARFTGFCGMLANRPLHVTSVSRVFAFSGGNHPALQVAFLSIPVFHRLKAVAL
jgi:hypothetical protein